MGGMSGEPWCVCLTPGVWGLLQGSGACRAPGTREAWLGRLPPGPATPPRPKSAFPTTAPWVWYIWVQDPRTLWAPRVKDHTGSQSQLVLEHHGRSTNN